MKPLVRVEGIACPLGLSGVDTDQIIPARFMKQPRSKGYSGFLLHDLRHDEVGAEHIDFPLNRPVWRHAPILVARRNFGSGSSREAAVYALADHGIRAVLAPTFGDIFASNAVKNGLLPAVLDEATIEDLLGALQASPDTPVAVDLATQTVTWGNHAVPFAIDPVAREQLLNGWDDIDVTRSYAAEIERFRASDAVARSWSRPGEAGGPA